MMLFAAVCTVFALPYVEVDLSTKIITFFDPDTAIVYQGLILGSKAEHFPSSELRVPGATRKIPLVLPK